MRPRRCAAAALGLLLAAAQLGVVGVVPAWAQGKPSELSGAKDPAVASRFKGAVLQNAASESFASLRLPLGPGQMRGNELAFDKSITVEGAINAYYYVQPAGVSPLEVMRNYQDALVQAGFQALFSCELQACAAAHIPENYRNELLGPRRWDRKRITPADGSSPRELRYWSGKATRNGADVYAVVWVDEATSVWNAPTASVLVIEPKAMETGKVTATLEQMKSGLQADGKIALYGLYFDTGKAEVKAESKPQLDEMAKLLKADPALRVFIVGHTDNQGALEGNVALSQRRAEAVVAALAQQYGIDAKRMLARGVASYAPLASNAGDAGRAKNRRVELVVQ